MGSYAYCHECDHPLTEPSLNEAFLGRRECPECGAVHDLEDFEREAPFYNLVDRLDALEARVESLE